MKSRTEKKTEVKPAKKKVNIGSLIIRIVLILLILGLIGGGILGVMNAYVINSTKPYVYSLEDFRKGSISRSMHYDAVIVLGCAIWGSDPSPMLADRLRTAAAVYKTGCADRIIVSGDSEHPEKYDETGVMKRFLINENGIPLDKVECDPLGLSTYESMYRAQKKYNLKSIVVVTTGFHVARSVYDAHNFGIEAVGVEAINSGYVIKKYNYVREFIARGKDLAFTYFKVDYPIEA